MSGKAPSPVPSPQQAPAPAPAEWEPKMPQPFPEEHPLPALPADKNLEVLQRLWALEERRGTQASHPELATDRTRFDPLWMVENHLKKQGMTVTRNAEVNDTRYDLIATKEVQGQLLTIGVTITSERMTALSNHAVAVSVRRQNLFQDCLWVKSNIDAIVQGLAAAADFMSRP